MYSVTTSRPFWDSVVILPLIYCLYFHFDGQSHLGEKVQHFTACACKKRKLVLVSLLLLHRSCTLGKSLVICTRMVQTGWTWHMSNSASALLWASCYKTRSTDVSLFSSIGQSVFKWHCCWSDQKCVLSVYLIGPTQSPLHTSWNRLSPHPTQVNLYYYQNFYRTVAVIQGGKRSWIPSGTTHRHGPKFPVRELLQMTGPCTK